MNQSFSKRAELISGQLFQTISINPKMKKTAGKFVLSKISRTFALEIRNDHNYIAEWSSGSSLGS